MSYIYVNEQGSRIMVDGGYCVIETKDGTRRLFPDNTIEYVSVFGNVDITTPALQMFMKNKIPVALYSKNGSYFGRIMSNENINIVRQRKQFALSGDTDFSINISKRIIDAKINNQIVILSRYIPKNGNNEEIRKCVNMMKSIRKDLPKCSDHEQIMGYEGTAARYYFKGLSMCVVPEFRFSGRSRRPPKDAFNSMLSLGYSMLMNELYGAAEGKGLNVYAGFLHRDRERHPTLASELMEEWRSVIIDSLVMSLVNGREVDREDFTVTDNGVFLGDKVFKIFLKKYETKMRTETRYLPEHKGGVSYRRALWLQTSALAKAVDNEDETLYMPIYIR